MSPLVAVVGALSLLPLPVDLARHEAAAPPGDTRAGGFETGVFEPLTCEHTGAGAEYAVGPGQGYASIGDVPWAALAAGDTVRIFWRDEPYREKFLIQGEGTEDQPITVCGVPGPNGELPVIDGADAVTAPGMGYATVAGQARGLIHVSLGDDDEWGAKPEWIVIQGLHVRNAIYENGFTDSTGAAVAYTENAAGIFVERGEHVVIRGVELDGNGNGLFVASGDSEETRSRDVTLERSRVHGNGTPDIGSDRRHNVYTEADGMVVQFNEIGPLAPGALGAALKDRSAGTVIRYNHVAGGARSLDLVDAEDSAALVADDPSYRTTLVYGNVFVNDAAVVGAGLNSNMFHYGGDSGEYDNYRKGTLYFVHNTVVVRADQSGADQVARWQTTLFDLDTVDETAVVAGNVFDVEPVTPGAVATELDWGRSSGTIQLGVNWVSQGMGEWRYPDMTDGTISGLDEQIAGTDPGFVDASAGDYAPAPRSPLVGTAPSLPADIVALMSIDAEYAGPAGGRPRAGAINLGAFEATATADGAQTPVPETSDAGDEAEPSTTDASTTDTSPADTSTTDSGSSSPGPLGDDIYESKGPDGADSGAAHPCGPGVLCVGGEGSYSSINAAIGDAADGDVIQVAAGTYAEHVAVGAFGNWSPLAVTLLGGFSPDFSQRDASAYPSVIDGGGTDPGVQLHLATDATVTLDGFEITNGRGLGLDWQDGDGRGGGVYADQIGSGVVVISHNVIHGNATNGFGDGQRGGGIYAAAEGWNGGAGSVLITDNVVADNDAGRGAAIDVEGLSATIANNLIEDNRGHSDHGGGVYLSAEHNTVTDNIVRGNVIGADVGYGWGGGLLIAAASATFEGNVVTDNYAPSLGSGVFWDEGATGTMTDDVLVANRCPTDGRSGAAMFIDGGAAPSRVVADRLTVVGHACPDLPDGAAIVLEGDSTIDVTNSVLRDNGVDFLTSGGAERYTLDAATVTSSDPAP